MIMIERQWLISMNLNGLISEFLKEDSWEK